MPCRDYETDSERGARAAVQRVELKNKLDQVTKMLCGLCRRIESKVEKQRSRDTEAGDRAAYAFESLIIHDEELQEWWAEHVRRDEEQEAYELESEYKRLLEEDDEYKDLSRKAKKRRMRMKEIRNRLSDIGTDEEDYD